MNGNLVGLIVLALVAGVVCVCIKSDWSEFDEYGDDESDPYDGNSGV